MFSISLIPSEVKRINGANDICSFDMIARLYSKNCRTQGCIANELILAPLLLLMFMMLQQLLLLLLPQADALVPAVLAVVVV